MTLATREISRIALARGLLLAALVVFLARVFVPSLTSMTHSFPAYYAAARLVVEGRWTLALYDDAWFSAQVLELTDGRVSDHFSLHPPTTSLLLVPFAWLDLTGARIAWQLLNLALLALALWLLLQALGIRDKTWRALYVAFALLFPALGENLRVGQCYVLLLFLFSLSFWGETGGGNIWSGLGLGLGAGFKLSGAPLWLLLALRGRGRALVYAGGIALGVGLLAWLVLGTESWLAFLGEVLAYGRRADIASHPAFQTTPSFFQRLFVPSPAFNPTPLFDAPLLADGLTALVVIVALGITLWVARGAPLDLAFGSAVTLSVILFPLAAEYHYTLMLIPLAVVATRILDLSAGRTEWGERAPRTRLDVVWFAVTLILLCLPFDWNATYWNDRALTLFAYPRLYGGWLLWLWLLKQMLRPQVARAASRSGATP